MGSKSRRWVLRNAVLGGVVSGSWDAVAVAAPTMEQTGPTITWTRGFEGQRKADLGDGRYLNPILAGDHPDPAILKDGDDYYMTFSSFESQPALLLWHSRDLVNWTPLGTALAHSPGSVFAVNLCKDKERYYIYIPVLPGALSKGLTAAAIFVIYADKIEGPWSEPINLNIAGYIDPAHAVGEDGKRYLFLSGVSRVRLSNDGLSTAGNVEHVYDGWKYPEDWIVEAFALEGPKVMRRKDYFYLISAEGGTAGPATGHMVIAARSKSIHGPWENYPHNPLVRTQNAREAWWSRGHATLVEGPMGDWWMVYHGYENGFRTLGRQTLLEPVEWTHDDWPQAMGGDLSQPLPKPAEIKEARHGFALSDDFTHDRFGRQWSFYDPGLDERKRAAYFDGALLLSGKGRMPGDSSPVTCLAGDRAYEFSVEVEPGPGSQAGLLLFYSRHGYLGMGIDGQSMTTYSNGEASFWREDAPKVSRLYMKIENRSQIVSFFYSQDGVTWIRHGLRSEVSGYNTNTLGDLLSLRPALFVTGSAKARFRNFTYVAL